MLPMIVRLKIQGEEGPNINLLIPMVIVYILLLPVVIIAVPVLLISRYREKFNEIVRAFFALLWAAGGMEIHVKEEKTEVILKIY